MLNDIWEKQGRPETIWLNSQQWTDFLKSSETTHSVFTELKFNGSHVGLDTALDK